MIFKDNEFVKIKPGRFLMGSPLSDEERFHNEPVCIEAEIKEEFEIQRTPFTESQWASFCKLGVLESVLPKTEVSYNDVMLLIDNLNSTQNEYVYRLPTEKEWEYCCKAGTTTKYSFGDDEKELKNYAWYDESLECSPRPVGEKKPNSWGLYDMHGNCWEWTSSFYGDTSFRVVRGGSWNGGARFLRSAGRGGVGPGFRYGFVGFRLVRTKVSKKPIEDVKMKNTFKVDDRVCVYNDDYRVTGTVSSVYNGKLFVRIDHGNGTMSVYPYQCRRLIKKKRRRIWLNLRIDGIVTWYDTEELAKEDAQNCYGLTRTVEFIEVKKK